MFLADPACRLPTGYDFQQIPRDMIIIKVPRAADVTTDEIRFEFDPVENSVFLRTHHHRPLLCGRLFDTIKSIKHEVSSNLITVTALKSHSQHWPRCIAGPSSEGIDSKSEFLLGLDADSRGCYAEAWAHFWNAAQSDYCPALLFVADTCSMPSNPYRVSPDLDQSIRIYTDLYARFPIPEIGVRAAMALKERNRFFEARILLENCSGRDDNAKFVLGLMLSPIYGKLDDPVAAIEIFRSLAARDHPAAIRCLAKHYELGNGIVADQHQAKVLLERAAQIDGNRFETVIVPAGLKGVTLGAAVTVVVVLTGICIYLLRRNRK
jgi:hypothetical protein